MVATFASLINGGYYYQPHVVKQILSESGEPVKTINPTLVTQTISSDTSHTMREMMRAVVDYGTGGYVHMDGYSIGGKTGTAEKAGRDKTEYVISFMGFAPAENPEVLVYVVIDTPDCEEYNTSWSAQVLARAIMEKLLPYMGIQPDNADYDADIYLDADKLDEKVVKPKINSNPVPDPADKPSDTQTDGNNDNNDAADKPGDEDETPAQTPAAQDETPADTPPPEETTAAEQ